MQHGSNVTEAIGIDIGGTFIKAVRIDASGGVLQRIDTPTVDGRGPLIEAVRGVVAELGAGPVGIAAPGLASPDNAEIAWMKGRMASLEHLRWAEALGRPAVVLNDAQAAAVAEAWVGEAAGVRHAVLLTLGTRVGGGVICDGRLLQGLTGRAGSLGHLTIDLDGPRDIVNSPGSLEDLIGNHSVEARTGYASTAELVAAAAAGDAKALKHWRRSVYALACGITSIINAFDPEVIILGGGIALAGEMLFEPLREELGRIEWRPLGRAVRLVPVTLGDAAGAVGAARFAMTSEESP